MPSPPTGASLSPALEPTPRVDRADQYAVTVALAGAICRGPGTYQTRTRADRPRLIWVKGEKLKGWVALPVERVLEELGLLVLDTLEPASAVLGSPSFTLRVLGEGFTSESVIVWNGADEVTTYVSATEVTTGVNMATAGAAVTLGVAVRNAGGRMSNELPFTFAPAA